MRVLVTVLVLASTTAFGGDLVPLRIADPVDGHIHPSLCRTAKGTLVVTYGRVNHRDLRILRSTDGGQSWSEPVPFPAAVGKTYYPGSLTALRDGSIVHAWNRWSADDNEQEPRSVVYSISSDEAVTWSAPLPFPRTPEVMSVIRHPFVELAEDQWLVSLSDATFVYNPKTKQNVPFGDGRTHGLVPIVRTSYGRFVSGAGLRSTDDGMNWRKIDTFPDLKTQGWRHELVPLSNGWLLASEILGPGVGGERIRYVISNDDGLTWLTAFEYYNPGRAIGGRACPRTVQLDEQHVGVVFYDVDPNQPGGPGLFFLKIPIAQIEADAVDR